jgi:hypothetical protein
MKFMTMRGVRVLVLLAIVASNLGCGDGKETAPPITADKKKSVEEGMMGSGGAKKSGAATAGGKDDKK